MRLDTFAKLFINEALSVQIRSTLSKLYQQIVNEFKLRMQQQFVMRRVYDASKINPSPRGPSLKKEPNQKEEQRGALS